MSKSIQELFRVIGSCALWFAVGATWANSRAETRFREQIHAEWIHILNSQAIQATPPADGQPQNQASQCCQ